MSMNEKNVCRNYLIKERGFTQRDIETYLPEPEVIIHPFNRKLVSYVWPEDLVRNIIISDVELQRKIGKNRARRKKLEKAKKSKLLQKQVEETKRLYEEAGKRVNIVNLPLKALRKSALSHARDLYKKKDPTFNPYRGHGNVINTWEVNYIRHRLTSYDRSLKIDLGKKGTKEGQKILVNIIFDKIIKAYPHLKDECERQRKKHLNRIEGGGEYW